MHRLLGQKMLCILCLLVMLMHRERDIHVNIMATAGFVTREVLPSLITPLREVLPSLITPLLPPIPSLPSTPILPGLITPLLRSPVLA